jgi:hypothetical protein
MKIKDELRDTLFEKLRSFRIDERNIQSITEYFNYLEKNLPINCIINELYIARNKNPIESDLYLFSDNIQIKIPSFVQFDPLLDGKNRQIRKTVYEINPIKKFITSLKIEYTKDISNSSETAKLDYKLKSGISYTISGENAEIRLLESIINNILSKNLDL